MVQTPSPTSSSPLAISVKKGKKILRGSLHSVKGSIGSDLETLVYWLLVYLGLFFCFYNCCFYSIPVRSVEKNIRLIKRDSRSIETMENFIIEFLPKLIGS